MTLPTPVPTVRPEPSTPLAVPDPVASGRRDDLDGLRAVAILLVAIFHLWVHRVSGGVDVFLFLSGFFVGGGLLRSFARGRPVRLGTYLPRLARRLLPALAVTLLGVVAATLVLLPRSRWSDVSAQSLASLAYVENWYLALSGQDYGAADIGQSPLQHVWSLSVQGQLFVLVPLFLLGLWWLGRRQGHQARLQVLRTGLAVAAVASFAYAVLLTRIDQPGAYYDTFARAWEYLAGAILALVVSRASWTRTTRLLAGWCGLALVLATGVMLDGGMLFPGPWTLVPLAGAALVVLAGAGGHAVGVSRVLAWRPLAVAGAYAYAFYLWHWPVLVFVIAVRDRPVGWLAGSAVLVVSAGLAWATKRWVEDPIRRWGASEPVPVSTASARAKHVRTVRRLRVTTPLVALVAVVLVLPTAWLGYVDVVKVQNRSSISLADLEKYPGAFAVLDPGVFTVDTALMPIPPTLVALDDKPRAVFDGCGTGGDDAKVRVCSYGELTADRSIAVVGGSHAEHWIDALAEVGEREGFRVDTMIKWGCSLVDGGLGGVEFFAEDPSCAQWSQNAIDRILELRPGAVFTTATRPAPLDVPGREVVPSAYVAAWERLADRGIEIVAIRDTPWLSVSPVTCLEAYGPYAAECSVSRTDVLDEIDPLVEVNDATSERVHFIDLNDVVCPGDTCTFVQGNRIVYRDEHHLTATYVQTLATVLGERVLAALGW